MVKAMIQFGRGAGVLGGLCEVLVGTATTEFAGTVPGGESNGFVEEEQFSVVAGRHDIPVPVFVPQLADDPCLVAPPGPGQALVCVVQDASVAH